MIRRFLNFVQASLNAMTGGGQPKHSCIPAGARHIGGNADLNDILLKLLTSHDDPASVQSNWVLTTSGHKLTARVVRDNPAPKGIFNLQLDFYLELPDGRLMIESFAGIGPSKREAIYDGLHNFVHNSFHVIVSVILDSAKSDQIEIETWTINNRRRRVIIGGIGIRRFTDNEFNAPINWFPTVQKEIERLKLDERCHWIRCYYAQMAGETLAIEALLDNEELPILQDTMKKIDWPVDPDFYGLRIFLMVQEIRN